MNRKKRIRETVNYVILGLVGLFILIPFVYMVVTSLKSKPEIMSKGTSFFPQEIVWTHYQKVFDSIPYTATLWNSFFVSSVTTIIAIFFSTMVGYGIAKFQSRALKYVLFLFMTSLMIPPFMIALPLYPVCRYQTTCWQRRGLTEHLNFLSTFVLCFRSSRLEPAPLEYSSSS